MSGGPKRTDDKVNTIGIVVVGVCGAVMVYVTIILLQAFYMNNSSDIQTMADYGGQDVDAQHAREAQQAAIQDVGANAVAPGTTATYRIPIDQAMAKIVDDIHRDPNNAAHLVPALPASIKQPEPPAPAPAPAPSPDPAGAGSGSAAGTGSAAAPTGPAPGGHAP